MRRSPLSGLRWLRIRAARMCTNDERGGETGEATWTVKQDCKKCEWLWKEYMATTRACLTLVEKLREVTLAHDSVAMLELTPKVDEA